MSHPGTCERCGKVTEYEYRCKVKRFCSYSCSNAYKWEAGIRRRAEIVAFSCAFCGGHFSVKGHDVRTREKFGGGEPKYCSKECFGKAHAIPGRWVAVDCSECGKKLQRRADHAGDKAYCSKECQSKHTRIPGSKWSKYSPDLSQQRQYHTEYQKKNREKINALSRKWAATNGDYRKYIGQIRRAAGSITREEWRSVINGAGGRCAVCGSEESLQVDHIIPVAKGGRTDAGNLQVLCRPCNQSKGTKQFEAWLPKRLQEIRA